MTSDVSDLLKSKGFKENGIKKLDKLISIRKLQSETFIKSFNSIYNYLLDYSYTEKQIIKIITYSPTILGCTIDNLKNKHDNFINLGYDVKKIIKLTTSNPVSLLLSSKTVNQKIDDMIDLGFTKNNALKLMVHSPNLLNRSKEKNKKRIEDIASLGLSYEEVIKIISSKPQVFSCNIEKIEEKINLFLNKDYSKDEIISCIKKYPGILTFPKETIEKKINLYINLNMKDYVIINPMSLMQSNELTYARYMFLKNNPKKEYNNTKTLFLAQDYFIKKYGLSTEELLLKYPYEIYLKEEELRNKLYTLYLMNLKKCQEFLEKEKNKFIEDSYKPYTKYKKLIKN